MRYWCRSLLAIGIAALQPCVSMAVDKLSRSPVFDGKPIRIDLSPKSWVYVSVPHGILHAERSARGDQVEVEIEDQIEKKGRMILRGIDPPEYSTITIVTNAQKTYLLDVYRSENNDTYRRRVTILDEEKKEEIKPIIHDRKLMQFIQSFKEVEATPYNNDIMAVWYSQWSGDPRYAQILGVNMKAVEEEAKPLLSGFELQRLWAYRFKDVYGYTERINNFSGSVLTVPLRDINELVRQGYVREPSNLYSINQHPRGSIPVGGHAYLHLTYSGGDR